MPEGLDESNKPRVNGPAELNPFVNEVLLKNEGSPVVRSSYWNILRMNGEREDIIANND